MKLKLFILSVLLLLAAIVPTHAQYNLGSASVANINAATTNSSVGLVIAVPKGQTVAIQPKFQLAGAGTTAVTFILDRSVDGSTWETGFANFTITPAGTSVVTAVNTQTLGSVGYLRINEIRNPNASAINSMTVKWSQKVGQ